MRHQGIGSAMLQKLIDFSKNNAKTITLELIEENPPAISLYKKFGFQIIGKREKYYNGKQAALIMTKYLI